jgi:Bacterial PH domain/Short C-terminal domain
MQERQAKPEAVGLRPDIAEASARMGWKFGGKREIKKLHEHLYEGERVTYLAQGAYDGNQGVVALTDQRLLFVFHGLMSQAVEDFPLDRLSSVQTKAGLATGDLTVHASGNSAVIKSIIKPDLKYLGDALRQHIGTGKPTPAPAPITPIDVADQLAKLAALRDQGVLTEEEFAAQKAKLLGLR